MKVIQVELTEEDFQELVEIASKLRCKPEEALCHGVGMLIAVEKAGKLKLDSFPSTN